MPGDGDDPQLAAADPDHVAVADPAGDLDAGLGAHIAFFVALAAHLSTNLRPRILTRML